MLALSIFKLAKHKQNKRIWIATQDLLKAGFTMGQRISIVHSPENHNIVINKDDNGERLVSGRSEDHPIIDIKNQKVAQTLGSSVDKVEVRFYDGKIQISVSKKEQLKNERTEKTGNNFFECFAGGGTLHHLFKKAGFKSVGGLELDGQFVKVFDDNHANKETVTICASIEDVSPDDYPKDVDLFLAGIPCTSFSNSNIGMKKELSALKRGDSADMSIVAKRYESEALVYHVLRAIEAMNPRQICIEEVVQFADTNASMMLRTVLDQMGYKVSEAIVQAKHTKRKRWCLIADMNKQVDLTNLVIDDGKTIEDFLDIKTADRDWIKVEDSKRLTRASKTIGLRAQKTTETKISTITTHGTRSTEPALQHPTKELYSELTNKDIANLHGLVGFKLPDTKTLARKVLGQGVADVFLEVALRIIKLPVIAQRPLFALPEASNGDLALFALPKSDNDGQLHLF